MNDFPPQGDPLNPVAPPGTTGGPSPTLPNKTQFGNLDERVAAMLCYLPICGLNLILAIVFLITERKNRFVRFHAMQVIALGVALIILSLGLTVLNSVPLIGFVFSVASVFIAPAAFVLSLFLAYKAYQGEYYKLPTIGDFAERMID